MGQGWAVWQPGVWPGYGNQGMAGYPQMQTGAPPLAMGVAAPPNSAADLTGSYLGAGADRRRRAISACRT